MSIKLKGSTDGSVSLQAPADTSPTGTDKTFTLPTQDGDAGQILKTDGSGALSFTDNYASNRNLVANGAMRLAQRSTSGTTTSSGTYLSVDRWKCTDGGEGAFTVSQSSTAPDGFANSVKWDCTTADTSISSEIYMEQLIEGQDLQHLKYGTSSAKSITISFWVRSNLTGQFGVWLENFDSSRYFTTSGYTINTADTWEYKTITIPGDTAGSGFDNDNEVGMKLRWHLAVRSSYQGTPSGSWSASASNRSQSSHVNLASSTANEWYLTGVQVEVGDGATSYEHRSFGDELIRCQRYYQEINPRYMAGQFLITDQVACQFVPFYVVMRSTPTATYTGMQIRENNGNFASTTLTSNAQLTEKGLNVVVNRSGAATGDSFVAFITSAKMNAEL